jgi:hypothetical protein
VRVSVSVVGEDCRGIEDGRVGDCGHERESRGRIGWCNSLSRDRAGSEALPRVVGPWPSPAVGGAHGGGF